MNLAQAAFGLFLAYLTVRPRRIRVGSRVRTTQRVVDAVPEGLRGTVASIYNDVVVVDFEKNKQFYVASRFLEVC